MEGRERPDVPSRGYRDSDPQRLDERAGMARYERFDRLVDALAASGESGATISMVADHPDVRDIYAEFVETDARLAACAGGLLRAHVALVECFEAGGKVMLCGNGGSYADALHMSAELLKGFERDRRLQPEDAQRFEGLPFGVELGGALEKGLPVMVLGANGSLVSAVGNDSGDARLCFAQECFAMVREGDVLVVFSTSGGSVNVRMAVSVARSAGATSIAFCGGRGGPLVEEAEIAIQAPSEVVGAVQEQHVCLYHCLCRGVEAHFFPPLLRQQS